MASSIEKRDWLDLLIEGAPYWAKLCNLSEIWLVFEGQKMYRIWPR